jgi:amidohydrolase
MSILLACADYISSQKNDKQIILLFQPSEENGKGAARVYADPKFKEIKPDFILSFHNLPGYKKNLILLKENIFAAASVGMIIKLQGVSTHAAHPENGINPVCAVTNILQQILKLNDSKEFEDFALATPIHTKIGERAFGTSPHRAEILITLRAYKDDDLQKLKTISQKIVEKNAVSEKLNFSIEWDDEFQSTINEPNLINELEEVCKQNKIEYQKLLVPFRWSEDFGVFTHQIKGAMFGIGSGENSPQLHNPDYDFPDDIVPAAVKTILALIQKLN